MTSLVGVREGTLTDSPCRADLVQKAGVLSRAGRCHSKKETAWAAGAEGALCPTCSHDPQAQTSSVGSGGLSSPTFLHKPQI